jgi:hypothetical protein
MRPCVCDRSGCETGRALSPGGAEDKLRSLRLSTLSVKDTASTSPPAATEPSPGLGGIHPRISTALTVVPAATRILVVQPQSTTEVADCTAATIAETSGENAADGLHRKIEAAVVLHGLEDLEPTVLIETLGLGIKGVDNHGTRCDRGTGIERSFQSVEQKMSTDFPRRVVSVTCQPSNQRRRIDIIGCPPSELR